jgi:hypothetical protein
MSAADTHAAFKLWDFGPSRWQLVDHATTLGGRLQRGHYGRSWPEPEATVAAGGVRCLGLTCRRTVGPNPPLVTLSGHEVPIIRSRRRRALPPLATPLHSRVPRWRISSRRRRAVGTGEAVL